MNEDHKRPAEIERDIEQTRADLAATIDAIQQKLTPGQLIDQALGYLRTSLPAEFGHNLSDTIRHNPLPVALIGVGIAWAALTARQDHSARFASSLQPLGMDPENQFDDERSTSEKVRQTVRTARESLHRANEKLHHAGDRSRASLHRMADRSQESYDRVRSTIADLVDEQPLMVGALGLAVGAALGALLPRTDREDELMGGARDEMLDSAAETAREVAERAAESARDVADRAVESIRETVQAAPSAPGTTEHARTQPTAPMHANVADDRARTPPISRPAPIDNPFRGEPGGDRPGRPIR